jgi:hypothetical protein
VGDGLVIGIGEVGDKREGRIDRRRRGGAAAAAAAAASGGKREEHARQMNPYVRLSNAAACFACLLACLLTLLWHIACLQQRAHDRTGQDRRPRNAMNAAQRSTVGCNKSGDGRDGVM